MTFSILIAMGWLAFGTAGLRFTGAMAFVAGTLAYYLRLDPVLATLMAVIMIPVTYAADRISRLPMPLSGGIFVVTLGLGVAFQAWGHVIERKRPALVDNFFQAVFTAPLFLLIEALEGLGWKGRGSRAAGAQDRNA